MRNNVDCSTHLLLLMSYAEEQKLCFECLKIELNKSYRRKLIVWKKFFGAMLSGEGGGKKEREKTPAFAKLQWMGNVCQSTLE